MKEVAIGPADARTDVKTDAGAGDGAETDLDTAPAGTPGAANVAPAKRAGGRRNGPPVVRVQPIARPAHLKKRHWGLLASFGAMVLVPFVAAVFYLWTFAQDQYLSTAAFTVRSQETGSANELLGGLAQFAGGTTATDSDILYEFIQSQEMVQEVDQVIDLRAHYAAHWPSDWVFALWPDPSIEDLTWYWHRIVGIAYDSSTGLTEITVSAYDPETAQAITREIVRLSQDRINALNDQAREDAMGYARDDLEEAVERLKAAREALTAFRTRTRIVDPETDVRGRMGVLNNLQQKLATALVELDLLRTTASDTDPRVTNAQQLIDVIRERIRLERAGFASDSSDTGGIEENYPELITEYEGLNVDRDYAEQVYRVALTAMEAARDDATRQSRYLSTYISPTIAHDSEYPKRFVLAGLAGLFLLLFWSILALIYYSVRDRS